MGLRVRKGDKVFILSGKDKGKTGKVIHVYPKKGRALVEGINMMKKCLRKSQQHPQGAIVSQEVPIQMSNLSLLDPVSNKPTRLRVLIATDVVSEGQNLQDCGRVLNYDLHWNPVRLIQRFGRVDRIGTEHDEIHLHNMWPDLDIDADLNLTARLLNRIQTFHDFIGLWCPEVFRARPSTTRVRFPLRPKT